MRKLLKNKPCVIFFFLLIVIGSCKQSETEQIDPDLPTFNVLIGDKDAFGGFIMLRKTTDPGIQLMIDASGDVQWSLKADTTLMRAFYPYQDGFVGLVDENTIAEISFQGDTLNFLDLTRQEIHLHHEIIKSKNGGYLGITDEYIPIDLSTFDGLSNDTVKTDGIVWLSSSGEILWKWRLDQVLNPLNFPEISKKKKDWGHANALAEDDDGNYLISWRDFNEIWKIDAESGELIWKYGLTNEPLERGKGAAKDAFYLQHAIHKSPSGEYLIFDNGNPRFRESSRAFGFRDNKGQLVPSLSITLPDSLFSFKQGSVYEIPDDRLLFCSSMSKYLIITKKTGEIEWLAYSDETFYRAYYIPGSWIK